MGRGNSIEAAIDELVCEARTLGLPISPAAVTKFRHYIELLLLWRGRISLTTAATPLAVVRDHIIDSLHLCCEIDQAVSLVDLGSGAGFPGIPTAIVNPGSVVTLVDSRRKRASFLREVIRRASLTNVRVAEQRAESLQRMEAVTYDVVTSRAFASVADILELSEGLLKYNGRAILMKGPRGEEEADYEEAGFSPPRIVPYRISGDRQRLLLIYSKT